jgi:hypothetical protein
MLNDRSISCVVDEGSELKSKEALESHVGRTSKNIAQNIPLPDS